MRLICHAQIRNLYILREDSTEPCRTPLGWVSEVGLHAAMSRCHVLSYSSVNELSLPLRASTEYLIH